MGVDLVAFAPPFLFFGGNSLASGGANYCHRKELGRDFRISGEFGVAVGAMGVGHLAFSMRVAAMGAESGADRPSLQATGAEH